MSGGEEGRRQRAVMATDEEWERISRRAAASGMELSRFIVIDRALAADMLAPEVLRRAVRETAGDVAARGAAPARGGPGHSLGARLRRGGRVDRPGRPDGPGDRSRRGQPLEGGGTGSPEDDEEES